MDLAFAEDLRERREAWNRSRKVWVDPSSLRYQKGFKLDHQSYLKIKKLCTYSLNCFCSYLNFNYELKTLIQIIHPGESFQSYLSGHSPPLPHVSYIQSADCCCCFLIHSPGYGSKLLIPAGWLNNLHLDNIFLDPHLVWKNSHFQQPNRFKCLVADRPSLRWRFPAPVLRAGGEFHGGPCDTGKKWGEFLCSQRL